MKRFRRSELRSPELPAMQYNAIERGLGNIGLRSLAMRMFTSRVTWAYSKAYLQAAENNRITKGYKSLKSTDPNEIISSDAQTARQRAEWLAINDPYGENAVARITENTVGEGVVSQCRIRYSRDRRDNQRANDAVEDIKKRWMEKADSQGRMHWYDMQDLVLRRITIAGEVMIQRKYIDDPKRILPLAYDIIDASRLTEFRASPMGGNTLVQGVEMDVNGAPVAYHVSSGGYREKVTRVAAEDMIHPFVTLWPGQVRGVTWFAPVIESMYDRRELHEYALIARKVQSAIAVIVSHDPLGGASPGIPGFNAQSGENLTTDLGDIERPIEPGMIQDAGTGKITSHVPAQTHDLEEYTRIIGRGMGIGLGLSYEWVTGDYSKTSHSGGRLANQHPRKHIKRVHSWFCRRVESPVHHDFIDIALAVGLIRRPGKKADPAAVRFSRPQWEWGVNPYQEVNAAALAMEKSISTIRDEVEGRGGDWEDFMTQISEEIKFGKGLGLKVHETLAGVDTAADQEDEDDE